MEYYKDKAKKKILSFVETWMSLEGIMVNEISQTEKYCTVFHLYVEPKKNGTLKNRVDGGWGGRGMGNGV